MGGFIALSLVYVIWSVTYTIVDVPYWALSTAMTNDTTKRGNMLTIARLICTLGAGIVTVGVPIVTDALTAKFKYTAENMDKILVDKAEQIAQIVANQGKTVEEAAKNLQNWVQ